MIVGEGGGVTREGGDEGEGREGEEGRGKGKGRGGGEGRRRRRMGGNLQGYYICGG